MFDGWLKRIGSWVINKELPIEVFVRHCHYSAVSAHKTRFTSFSRERCFSNLLDTLENQKRINVTFFLDTFHEMQGEHFLRTQTRYPVIEHKAGSEAASFLFMLEHVSKQRFSADTILYFLEDDYLHLPNWPNLLREALALPGVDYATLYDHKDKYFLPQYFELQSKIFHTASCHWRTTPSTTNTYAMFFKTLQKHMDVHRAYSLGRQVSADHEKFLKLAEHGATLVSSIPGFATHAEPAFASPCVDWEKFFI